MDHDDPRDVERLARLALTADAGLEEGTAEFERELPRLLETGTALTVNEQTGNFVVWVTQSNGWGRPWLMQIGEAESVEAAAEYASQWVAWRREQAERWRRERERESERKRLEWIARARARHERVRGRFVAGAKAAVVADGITYWRREWPSLARQPKPRHPRPAAPCASRRRRVATRSTDSRGDPSGSDEDDLVPARQLTLDLEFGVRLAQNRAGCPACATRDAAKDPPCSACGRDFDPTTKTGIPF